MNKKNKDIKLNSMWFTGEHMKDPEKKKQMQDLVLGSYRVIERLRDICLNEIKNIDNIREIDYNTNSWAYKQAHLNGMREVCSKMLKLFDHIKE